MGALWTKLSKLHLSTTFWLNALAVSLELVNEGFLNGVIPAAVILKVTVILNILNRIFITKKPLQEK
jgi:hypothetical protein